MKINRKPSKTYSHSYICLDKDMMGKVFVHQSSPQEPYIVAHHSSTENRLVNLEFGTKWSLNLTPMNRKEGWYEIEAEVVIK